ncbi:MAG: hypothetical protein ACJ8J0_06635 [Longimicrobiaceae bacterium]
MVLSGSAPPLSLGAAFLVGMGCAAWLWQRLVERWRSAGGMVAAGAVAAVPLFLLLRLSVANLRGWQLVGFVRAGAAGLLAGAVCGWYVGRRASEGDGGR